MLTTSCSVFLIVKEKSRNKTPESPKYGRHALLTELFPFCYFFQGFDWDCTYICNSLVVQYISIEVICFCPRDGPSAASCCLPLLPCVRSVRPSHCVLGEDNSCQYTGIDLVLGTYAPLCKGNTLGQVQNEKDF